MGGGKEREKICEEISAIYGQGEGLVQSRYRADAPIVIMKRS